MGLKVKLIKCLVCTLICKQIFASLDASHCIHYMCVPPRIVSLRSTFFFNRHVGRSSYRNGMQHFVICTWDRVRIVDGPQRIELNCYKSNAEDFATMTFSLLFQKKR